MDVAGLVSQMNDTLSAIHVTLGSLSTTKHHERLEELEQKRDGTVAALRANFERERDDLAARRKREREETAEARRREDEQIAARRRREDEELAARCYGEDDERQARFDGENRELEDEMDGLMENIESEAQRMIEEGKQALAALEVKRRELNRLIDEQLDMPLPAVPTRKRSRSRSAVPAIASH